MTDKFIDPATKKEMFRINDSNQETFSKDYVKPVKEKTDGTDHNGIAGESGSTTDDGKES